jgi:hypothetical protein
VLELSLAFGLTTAGIVPASDVPDWSMTFLFEKVIPGLKGGRDDRRAAGRDDGRQPWPATRLGRPAGVV